MFKLLPCCLALLAIAIGESADIQLRASGTQRAATLQAENLAYRTRNLGFESIRPSGYPRASQYRIRISRQDRVFALCRLAVRSRRTKCTERSSLVCSTRHDRHLLRRHANYLSA